MQCAHNYTHAEMGNLSLFPFYLPGDLQMNCIQLLVNQCHKAKGLKLLATHVLNMMLQGCLQVYTCTCIDKCTMRIKPLLCMMRLVCIFV